MRGRFLIDEGIHMADLISDTGNRRRLLRDLLDGYRPPFASGHDAARCAHLVAHVAPASFDAVYMGGFAIGTALLGSPDIALLDESGMIDHARRIVQSVGLPVIADANIGRHAAQDLARIVHDYEQAGVAALQFDDTAALTYDSHMSGKSLIPVAEMLAKLQVAAAARTDPDLILIARTEALAIEGADATIERARRYAEAGADLLWIEARGSAAEHQKIAAALDGYALLLNWREDDRAPAIDIERIRRMRFALVLFPLGAVLALAGELREQAAAQARCEQPIPVAPNSALNLPRFEGFTDTANLRETGARRQVHR
jgi:2-methylisocitrate lyase-like PEP mutase family enzyme